MKANAKARWRNTISELGCLVGRRFGGCGGAISLHHISEGSGLRDEWALVPLCYEHHQGAAGLHGLGPKSFLRLYRPPGESEWGLMAWMCEDLAKRTA